MKKKKETIDLRDTLWGSLDGRKTKMRDLSDDHLRNIIKDGYVSRAIIAEAEARDWKCPELQFIKLDFLSEMQWLESFASCALAGNSEAKRLLTLHKTNRLRFLKEMERYMKMAEESRKNKPQSL